MGKQINVMQRIAICGALAIASMSASASTQASADNDVRAFLGPALTAEVEQWDKDFTTAQREHADALATKGDAQSLLGAVLIYPRWTRLGTPLPATPPKVARWFAHARAAAPDDALLAWIEATACPVPASGCDRPAALERLRALDPGNAAVWLELMRDAAGRGDDADAGFLFRQAAIAERYDMYLLPLGELLRASGEGLTAPAFSADLAAKLQAFSDQTG